MLKLYYLRIKIINSCVHLSKKHNLKMIKCQKHLFNLDHKEYYLNCAYKSPLLKKGELLAINAIKKERTPSYLKPNNYFEISGEIRKEFSKIIERRRSLSGRNRLLLPLPSNHGRSQPDRHCRCCILSGILG